MYLRCVSNVPKTRLTKICPSATTYDGLLSRFMILLNNFSGSPSPPSQVWEGGEGLPKFGKGGNKKFGKGGGFPNFFSGSPPPLPKFFVASFPKFGKGGRGFLEGRGGASWKSNDELDNTDRLK